MSGVSPIPAHTSFLVSSRTHCRLEKVLHWALSSLVPKGMCLGLAWAAHLCSGWKQLARA